MLGLGRPACCLHHSLPARPSLLLADAARSALGVLVLAALMLPAGLLAVVGLLGPALIAAALATVLIAVGLSVSAYDAGRTVAHRPNLPVPDAVVASRAAVAAARASVAACVKSARSRSSTAAGGCC